MKPLPSVLIDEAADARSTPRRLSRVAILAPFAAVMTMFVAGYLDGRDKPSGIIFHIGSVVSVCIVIGGLIAGTIAIVGAVRRGSRDTFVIAAIGLMIGGGFALFAARVIWYWLNL